MLHSVSMSKRNVIDGIELLPAAQQIVDATAVEVGMTKREVIVRIFRWFSEQNDVIRGTILGTAPKSIMVDVAKLMLERMAGGGAASIPIESGAISKLRKAALLRGESLDGLADSILSEAEAANRNRTRLGAALDSSRPPLKK